MSQCAIDLGHSTNSNKVYTAKKTQQGFLSLKRQGFPESQKARDFCKKETSLSVQIMFSNVGTHMLYVKATALSIFLFLPQAAVIAQEAIEPEPSLEEIEALDANFGPDDYAAMRARYSDEIPKPPDPVTPATLVAKADLVIEGTVRDIYYTYEGDFKQAYTHTVIDVTRVLQGEHTESTLTITQMGGPSQDGTTVNIVSHTEYFNVGERELLFFKSDNEGIRIKNRYRVYEGDLYNVDGYGLLSNAEGSLRLRDSRNPAERFRTINIGTEVLYKNLSEPDEHEADDAGEHDGVLEESEATLKPAETIMTLDAFVSALER